ncbi:hypothetical protein SAMN05421505_12014 [Sinosporangium album]|uniref:Uncharacterized protein n=1 Tax=Sinosporangium album TaxID=504805 RepID=A0A1G8EB51_9ACTN|nr:hypothetical protein SAMN05421505_12014 [Sinosporangium album]
MKHDFYRDHHGRLILTDIDIHEFCECKRCGAFWCILCRRDRLDEECHVRGSRAERRRAARTLRVAYRARTRSRARRAKR